MFFSVLKSSRLLLKNLQLQWLKMKNIGGTIQNTSKVWIPWYASNVNGLSQMWFECMPICKCTMKPKIPKRSREECPKILLSSTKIRIELFNLTEKRIYSLMTMVSSFDVKKGFYIDVLNKWLHILKITATVYEDQDRIVQLDGETDLLLDDDGNLMNQPGAGTSTSSSSLSGSGANSGAGVSNNSSGGGNTPGSGPTQLFILKSTGQDDKVYQCPQCPEVFPGQKALLTHQSLVHRNSQTSTIFPCQHCSIGFKDAKSLDLHVRLEHGKNNEKFQYLEKIVFLSFVKLKLPARLGIFLCFILFF